MLFINQFTSSLCSNKYQPLQRLVYCCLLMMFPILGIFFFHNRRTFPIRKLFNLRNRFFQFLAFAIYFILDSCSVILIAYLLNRVRFQEVSIFWHSCLLQMNFMWYYKMKIRSHSNWEIKCAMLSTYYIFFPKHIFYVLC